MHPPTPIVPPSAAPPQRVEDGMAEPTSPVAPSPDRWKAWDALIESRADTGFMQASWWVDFRNACGFDNFGITLKDGKQIVGGGVVLRYSCADDTCFYYIQDGPVVPGDPDAAEYVFQTTLDAVDERRQTEPCPVSHLRIEPRWLSCPDFVRGFRSIAPLTDRYLETRDTRWIDLRPSESEILAQMKPKGRYNIGVARRHGVEIVEDVSAQGLADFQNIYEETALRQRLNPKPPDYFEMLLAFAKRQASLFFAEYQGLRLATALVVFFGPRATYFYGGSRDLHRQVMAPYLLHFEIMRKAKALGHLSYDLWGIAPPNQPEHPWQNISVFKAKFGGQEVHLVATLDYVYDEAAYARYSAAA